MTMIPLDRNGQELQEGDILTDFRGDTAVFIMMTRPPARGKSAKIYVDSNGFRTEYYHTVFGITFAGMS